MKSAATALLETFGVTGRIRPASIEDILVSLLFTINNAGLLNKAISDISNYTTMDLQTTDHVKFIKSVTSSPELVGLYNKQKAMQLLLYMKPAISMIEEYDIIVIPHDTLSSIVNRNSKSNRYRETKKILQQINALNLGYYVIQPPNVAVNEFHIIKANSRSDIISVLKKYKLQNPSVLDSLLKGIK